MQALAVLKVREVVEPTLVWQVETNSPVYAYDEVVEVVAQTHTCAYGHLLEHVLKLELAVGPVVVIL